MAEWPGSIREINSLDPAARCAIYRTLIPSWVFTTYGIDPVDLTYRGERVVDLRCPAGSSSVEITVYHAPGASDPMLHLHLGDTFNWQLSVLMVVVNDPGAPRFNVDLDASGQRIPLGSGRRNLAEEARALQAGLAPGQIRAGLRVFRTAIPVFERFVERMGHDLFLIEPLFYHNAITFERYGFAYLRGRRRMEQIHQDFLPGGPLHARLTGENPFRCPEAWRSVRGRSWAIHDGILGEPFSGVQMYKRVGHHAGVTTFPGAVW